MSAEPLLSAYLLTGTDRPKVARALSRLRAHFAEESVELLDAQSSGGSDVVGACNALGLFGDAGARLVVVDGVESWGAADVDAVAAYLADPTPGTVLALRAYEPPRNQALADAVARAGKVLAYEVPKPRSLPGWVASEFARLGAEADAEASRALVEIVGEDVVALATEVEKIATWAGERPVGVRDLTALAVAARDTEAWALTDAWGSRDLTALLQACELALEAKEAFVLALGLASHVGRVRAAQALAEQGLTARDVAKRLRMKEFPARKALAHAEKYTRDELDNAVVRLADLDARLKGASRLSPELELERALVDVTRPRAQASVG